MSFEFPRFAFVALASGAMGLTGCGSQNDTVVAENESAESVAEKVAKMDVRPEPGRWESKMTIEKFEVAGMPPEVQGMMQQQIGKVRTSFSCLTKEEAEKADGEFFKPEKDSGCKYNKFAMGGGKVEADMTCEQGPATQNMKMSGTYGKEAYSMRVNADGDMDGKAMSMAMTIASRRVGDCTGKEES